VNILEDSFVISRILLVLIQRDTINELELEKLQFIGFEQSELMEQLIRLEFMKFHSLHHHYQYKRPIITTIILSKDIRK
jgi:hypothetical protein